jgi:hypothetical protein
VAFGLREVLSDGPREVFLQGREILGWDDLGRAPDPAGVRGRDPVGSQEGRAELRGQSEHRLDGVELFARR